MKKGKGIAGLIIRLGLLALVISVSVLYYYSITKADENIIVQEESVPDGVPQIHWNTSSPDKSYRELTELLSDLEPKIAIADSDENLEWEDICRDNFWVESFKISGTVGGNVKTYIFTYKDDADKNKTMQAQIDAEVEDILSLVPENADDWETALIIHDELVRRITYDEDASLKHSHDIYGAFVEHRAVCQGYTYSMTYLAERLGMQCDEVYSDTHIWNKFSGFDSSECYTDITWDDIDKYDADGKPYIIHDNFGLLKSEMEKLSQHQPESENDNAAKSNTTGDNYFRKKGWYIPNGDMAALEIAVKEQLESGGNLIELRFAAKSDYDNAKDTVHEMLRRMGYNDSYFSWQNENHLIYTVGLNPPPDD